MPPRGKSRTEETYILQNAGCFKIGYALDVESRHSQLKTGSPLPTYVIGVFGDTGKRFELELHQKFHFCRIDDPLAGDEWFRPHPDLLWWMLTNRVFPVVDIYLIIQVVFQLTKILWFPKRERKSKYGR